MEAKSVAKSNTVWGATLLMLFSQLPPDFADKITDFFQLIGLSLYGGYAVAVVKLILWVYTLYGRFVAEKTLYLIKPR